MTRTNDMVNVMDLVKEDTMDIGTFGAEVRTKVQELVDSANDFEAGTEVGLETIYKNNGNDLLAIIIREEKSNVFPTIYLEQFFDDYKNGISVDRIAQMVVDVHKTHSLDNRIDVGSLTDWERVKDNVVCRVVSKSLNEKLLEEAPHEDFLDLAVIYTIVLGEFGDSIATVVIKNPHLEKFGITQEELAEISRKNTPTVTPHRLSSLNQILSEIDDSFDELPEGPMLIATNTKRTYGASAFLDKEFLAKSAERLGEKFFILPSSIHELMFVRDDDQFTAEELKGLVTEVNDTQVAEKEILSYSVYQYNNGKVSIAA